MRFARVSVIIPRLIDTDRINFQRHLTSLHHCAKAWVEGTLTFGVVTIITFGTPIWHVVGESPRRRYGSIENDITRFLRNFRSHGLIQGKIRNMQRMLPILTLSITFHMKYCTILIHFFVRFGEPIQTSSTTRLPFQTESVWGLKMLGTQLLHGPNGVSLKGLLFASCDWFILFGWTQISSVEEGVEGGVPRYGEVIIPVFGDGCGVS
mmetsp:Transcript_1550/g.2495  ORF Transcript_1550/g.2495 Transcript_1550/m.2495 type:complete len:208 (-) Transcript_1550:1104-1727(-)